MDTKVYIFDKLRTARDFQNTAKSHFGVEVERIGTALVMEPEVYAEIIEKTYAPFATMTAVKESGQ